MNEYPESFEIHEVSLKYKNGETFSIVPFGDIHRFSPDCSTDRWLEFCEWGRTRQRTHWIGMGDYLDWASASERRILESPDLHDSSRQTMDGIVEEYVKKFAGEIDFMRGNLFGLLEGNHYYKFEAGITSTQYLCRLLKTRYLGSVCFVRVNIGTGGGSTCTLTIFAAHGVSIGARTVSGGMGAVEKMELVAEADLYLQGHNHQKGALPFARLRCVRLPGGPQVLQSKGFFVRTGSFSAGYRPGGRSYISKRLLRPSDLGAVKIDVTPRRDQRGGRDLIRLDLHASI